MEPRIHKQWDITLQEVLNFFWEWFHRKFLPKGKVYVMWYVEGSPLYFDLTFISSLNFESVLMGSG